MDFLVSFFLVLYLGVVSNPVDGEKEGVTEGVTEAVGVADDEISTGELFLSVSMVFSFSFFTLTVISLS